MNIFNQSLRVGVFYDGNFLLHASNYYNYFHPQRRRLSLSGLHQYIKHRIAKEEECSHNRCQIVESHYFRGRINAAEASQRGNQLYNDRVFEDILMAEGIQTHYLPLRSYLGKKEERGIDVWLSLEAYEYALLDKIDVAVLIVADTDYAPLLRKLGSLGIRVMLLSWEFEYNNDEGQRVVTKTSHELLQLASYPIAVYAEIDEGLENGNPVIEAMFVDTDTQKYNDDESEEEEDRLLNKEVETSEVLSIKNGFGFVKYPNNNLYFHAQDVLGDFYELAPGDPVEFVIDKNMQRQDVAKRVRKI